MNSQKPGTKKREPFSEETLDVDGDVKDSVVIQADGNTIHFDGQKKTRKKRSGKKPQKPTGNYTVAWIGFAAVILGVVITGAMGWGPFTSATPSPTAFLTQTETSFPTATETAITTSLLTAKPAAIGEDWLQGCISQVWQAYPPLELEANGNGCWHEPVYAFSADNGNLFFLSERNSGDAEVYGLFAPLPESGSVTFTVRLYKLENIDLWMGIFAEPDVNSQGLLMIIPNGDVAKRPIVQKDPLDYGTIQNTMEITQGSGYSVSFVFSAYSVSSRINPYMFVTDPVSIPSSQKWLFLGYMEMKGLSTIEGLFFDISFN